MNSSNQRIDAYKSCCMASGIRPRKFGLDMDVRRNSTYLMLKHMLPTRKLSILLLNLIILDQEVLPFY
jgi:hypothetical protein